MATVKTAISIQENLFEQVESLAKQMNISRSHLFELAVQEYLLQYDNKILLEKINAAYADEPDPEEKEPLRRFNRVQRKMLEGEW